MSNIIYFFIFTGFLFSQYERYDCVIHLHSKISYQNSYELEEIIDVARQYDIDVVIPTDHFLKKITLGIFPPIKLLSKTAEQDSISKYGIGKYLEKINKINQKYKDIIIIPGLEVAPHYYSKWNFFDFIKGEGDIYLHNWHKHMLVIGLEKLSDHLFLPVVGNEFAGNFNPLLLYPFIFLFLSIFLFIKKLKRIAILSSIFFLFLFYNNFPFFSYPYNQYSEFSEKPYQYLIDYVNSKNGVIYWAHPEAPNYMIPQKINNVYFQTMPYHKSLLKTHNYTGFAYFWEGDENIGIPGGIWDELLKKYIKKEINYPVWAIGELDYIAEGVNHCWMDMIKNILYLKRLTKEDVMEALKCGRYYVINKPHLSKEPILVSFEILVDGKSGFIGETIVAVSTPTIKFQINSPDANSYPIKINIIRNGEIIKTINSHIPMVYSYTDKMPHENSFYRLEIKSMGTTIITNPIFLFIPLERVPRLSSGSRSLHDEVSDGCKA